MTLHRICTKTLTRPDDRSTEIDERILRVYISYKPNKSLKDIMGYSPKPKPRIYANTNPIYTLNPKLRVNQTKTQQPD